jgi:hypothetical protein
MKRVLASTALQGALAVLMAAAGALLILSTHTVFSQTHDEPAHVACGMEWLDRGRYDYQHLHPPLARVAAAIGPYLAGVRSMGRERFWDEGNDILHAHGHYQRNLALARLGIVPFYIAATLIVFFWGRRILDNTAAWVTTALFATLPPVLAHSALATTDAAVTATLAAALYAFTLWLKTPTLGRALLAGGTIGLTLLAKMSALAFLPACLAAALLVHLWERRRHHPAMRFPAAAWLRGAGLGALVAFLVIWGGYRFSVRSISELEPEAVQQWTQSRFQQSPTLSALASRMVTARVFPAIEYVNGMRNTLKKNVAGHACYVLGRRLEGSGVWYFFPVVLAVKTPLAFTLLAAVGFVLLLGHTLRHGPSPPLVPALAAIFLLAIVVVSNINLGVRHILPIYPLLALVAGYGALRLWHLERHRTFGRGAVLVLLTWHLISSLASHPDYLAYFNELAGGRPEEILVDSDLDWGQDLPLLVRRLHERGIDQVAIAYFGSADLSRFNLPAFRRLEGYRPTAGWLAVSLTYLKGYERYRWLESHHPVERVGRSIRLYHIREEDLAQ